MYGTGSSSRSVRVCEKIDFLQQIDVCGKNVNFVIVIQLNCILMVLCFMKEKREEKGRFID